MLFVGKELIASYEARIKELKEQIEVLKRLVLSPTSASGVPLLALEADAVMSGRETVIDITPEEQEQIYREQSEASRILSGTYGND